MKRISLMLLLTGMYAIGFSQTLKPWKISLPKGQKLQVDSKTDMNLVQTAMGQEITIVMDMTSFDSVLIVESTPGQSFKISKTTNRIQMNMSAMGQEKSFDSDKKEDMEGEMGAQMKESVHVTAEALVSENGTIKLLSGKNENTESGGMSAIMPPGMAAGNDSGFISNLFMVPPSKELMPGGLLKDSIVNEAGKVVNQYTYVSQENGLALFEFEAEATNNGTATRQGMEMKMNMKSQSKGTLRVDISNGLVVERTTIVSITGTNEMMGMEIPVTGSTKTTVTVKKY